MLSGVLLHQIEAARPVKLALHSAADGQRAVAGVDHLPVPLVDLEDPDAPQQARVIGLAAPLGVKGGLVQGDVKALLPLLAGENAGGKAGQVGILFI